MTQEGLYQYYEDGSIVRVMFTARQATKGPSEGTVVVVYIGLKYGDMSVMDEDQFNEKVYPPPSRGFLPGVQIPRYSFVGSGSAMSDKDAEELWDGLKETFYRKSPPAEDIDR